LTTQRQGGFEKTEVLYGIDKNVKAILEFINKSKNRYDVYTDAKGPFFVIKTEALKNAYVEFVRKGGHILYHRDYKREP
jgi:hypothetical protein